MSAFLGLVLACQAASSPCSDSPTRACLAESQQRGGYWDGDDGVESPHASRQEIERLFARPVSSKISGDYCVRVAKTGQAVEVIEQRVEGSPEQSAAVRDALSQVRFAPGSLNGRAVEVWVPFTVRLAPR